MDVVGSLQEIESTPLLTGLNIENLNPTVEGRVGPWSAHNLSGVGGLHAVLNDEIYEPQDKERLKLLGIRRDASALAGVSYLRESLSLAVGKPLLETARHPGDTLFLGAKPLSTTDRAEENADIERPGSSLPESL